MTSGSPLIIRTDAGGRIGLGHLMRCLALAEAWQDRGGQALFITACESDRLRQRLVQEGFELIPGERVHPDPHDWALMSEVLQEHPRSWVVLDGYHLDSSYQRRVKEAGHPLLAVDDMAHLEHYWADVILNQNLHATTLRYDAEPNAQFLLGIRYSLLRREFVRWRSWRKEIPGVAHRVLITLGGSDADNATLMVVSALAAVEADTLEAVVVVGADSPHYEALQAAACGSRHAIRLLRNVTDMSQLMAWADIAISAAGITVYELANLGVPMCLVAIAGNQEANARLLDLAGAARGLGSLRDLTPRRIAAAISLLIRSKPDRDSMSARGRELVDGLGAERVVMRLLAERLRLRPIERDDCRLLWNWANDPAVRAASFQQDRISWEEHSRWFEGKLSSPTARIYVALVDEATPIGQVRFEIDDLSATVSASLDPDARGEGFGSAAIWAACTELFGTTRVERIDAYVRPENGASVRAFRRAGFRNLGPSLASGHAAVHLVARREEWSS
jgi:UDP-2,4-diacetamido-2,4,6-trideoxy-beta-L-altropyranose hydrolase